MLVVVCIVTSGTFRALDSDLVLTELGVVKKEGCLRGRFLLECNGGALCCSLRCNVDVDNLAATVAKDGCQSVSRKLSSKRPLRRAPLDKMTTGCTYQKLKKSLISLSSVVVAMFVTLTVFVEAMVITGNAGFGWEILEWYRLEEVWGDVVNLYAEEVEILWEGC